MDVLGANHDTTHTWPGLLICGHSPIVSVKQRKEKEVHVMARHGMAWRAIHVGN